MSWNDENAILPMFADSVLKARWAIENIKNLDGWVRQYNSDGITVTFSEPKSGQHFAEWVIESEPITPPVTLWVGDIIRNLRASLDYSVSAIYAAHKKCINHAYFPTGDNRAGLENTIKGGLEKSGFKSLSDYFLNQVEATETGNGSAIWRLNKLDRTGKHRSLIVTTEVVASPLPDSIGPHGLFQGNALILGPGKKHIHSIPVGAGYQLPQSKPALLISFGENRFAPRGDLIPILIDFSKVVMKTLEETQRAYASAYL